MTGETIKQFLVGLGWDIDEQGLAKFNRSITLATVKVTALAASIEATGLAITKGITSISEDFEELGYQYRLIVPAINKAIILRRELFSAYARAGTNLQDIVVKAYRLNMSLTKTKFAFEAIYKSVAARFFPLFTKQSDLFRQRIYANMPKIQHTLEALIKFIFKMLEATTELGLRVWSILTNIYDFFVRLDKATNGWSTIVLGLITAWKLLNLEFLATPLGMLIAGLTALLVLFDDFKVWKEGGKSLFDWTKFVPVIDAVRVALQSVYKVLQDIGGILGSIAAAIVAAFSGNFKGALTVLKDVGAQILSYFKDLATVVFSITGALGSLGKWAADVLPALFGRLTAGGNEPLINKITGNAIIPSANPVSNNSQNTTNVHAPQQLNITVPTSAEIPGVVQNLSAQHQVTYSRATNMTGSFVPGGSTK